MQKRPILAAVAGGVLATTVAFLACSSGGSAAVDAGVDAGHKVGLPDVVTVFETSWPDSGNVTVPEAGPTDAGHHDSATHHDAAGDAGADATQGEAGPLAACKSLINAACDIVSQNCTSGNECAVVQEPDGSPGTACEPVQATEHLAKGAPCCPSPTGSNPCDPGLECNGGNFCADAGSPGVGLPPGWGGSRCTPRCCPVDGGGVANCGAAGDGGVQGQCDLGITFTNNGPAEYFVCSYPESCEPLHVHPCVEGFACLPENTAGTSTCTVISNPNGDAGATAGQACQYLNACADGLLCVGATAATSTCLWMCRVAGQATPFDAGVLKTTPGYGGCPAGKTCAQATSILPAWLGICQ